MSVVFAESMPHTHVMKKLISISLFILSVGLLPSAAADSRRILLDDGTELVGEILRVENGSYTIKTRTLGTLTVSERQIQSITRPGATVGSATQNSHASSQNPVVSGGTAVQGGQGRSSVQALQQRLVSDGNLMQQIMALQSTPEMQAVLSDPEVMAAIERMDFQTLANHPKIKRLMSNQTVRSISNSVN